MRAIILICAFVAVCSAGTYAPLLKASEERIDGKYIVKLQGDANVDKLVAKLKNDPIFSVLGGKIGRIYHTVYPGFAASLPVRALDLVRKLPSVEYVQEDQLLRIKEVESWGLDRIDQTTNVLDDQYNPYGTGKGSNIYVIDTGVLPTHVDFGTRAKAWADFGPDSEIHQGIDCHGHGTHCSGTAAGTAYGVAKEASIFGVRAMSCLGAGSTESIVAACDHVAANRNQPAVASMSIGGGKNAAIDDAVLGMIANNVAVSVAAGNEASDACNRSPAGIEDVITVGATSRDDGRASYSNWGTCVDMFAPGTLIKSAWCNSDTDTRTVSGTSMACPHVSGGVALLQEQRLLQNPSSYPTPHEIKAGMQNMALRDVVDDRNRGSENLFLYVPDTFPTV